MKIYLNYSTKFVKLSNQIIDYNGRPTFIAPVVMFVEGVHAGSAGEILYREEDLAYDPSRWDGIPVMIGHPIDNNKNPIRARHPEIILSSIGNIWNTYYLSERKKLYAEAWIDIEKLGKVNPVLLNAIKTNQPIEVSTGLFFDMIVEEGVWNDEKYIGIATNFAPDHLALLLDVEGACSLKDGCGIRNNKATGVDLDESNNNGGNKTMKRTKAQIDLLINCKQLEIVDNEENRKWLEEASVQEYAVLEKAANEFKKCDCQNKEDENKKNETIVSINKLSEENKKLKIKLEEFVANAKKEEPKKEEPKTVEQFLNSVPTQFKDILSGAYEQHIQYKNDMISLLEQNKKNRFTKETLENMSVENLQKMVELAGEEDYTGAAGSYEGNKRFDPHERQENGYGVPVMNIVNWQKK